MNLYNLMATLEFIDRSLKCLQLFWLLAVEITVILRKKKYPLLVIITNREKKEILKLKQYFHTEHSK